MLLSTSDKRRKFPARYVRKDARTAIYRALYGSPGSPDPQGRPELNDTRKLSELFQFTSAEATFKANLDAASFTPAEVANLQRRLDALRAYKPRKQA